MRKEKKNLSIKMENLKCQPKNKQIISKKKIVLSTIITKMWLNFIEDSIQPYLYSIYILYCD